MSIIKAHVIAATCEYSGAAKPRFGEFLTNHLDGTPRFIRMACKPRNSTKAGFFFGSGIFCKTESHQLLSGQVITGKRAGQAQTAHSRRRNLSRVLRGINKSTKEMSRHREMVAGTLLGRCYRVIPQACTEQRYRCRQSKSRSMGE